MKKILLYTFVLFAVTLFFSSVSHAQIVTVRPTTPPAVVVKPAAPYPHAIWIEPEWRWDGPTRAYVYMPGHWVKPHGDFVWVPGHWMSLPGGYQWVAGYWRRVRGR